MNSLSSQSIRVLAIDPSIRGFGFAVLEGPKRLIDWGVKSARQNKNAVSLAKVADLIRYYKPDVIVLENCERTGSHRCKRVQGLITAVIKLGAELKIRTRRFSPSQVRQAFADCGARTKHEIARAIADCLSELASRLPPLRRPWMSEDYRMNIFDAVSLALTFYQYHQPRQKTRPD